MSHPATNTPQTPQQIMNAGYDFSVSAFRTTGSVGGSVSTVQSDAGAFRVSAFEGGYAYNNIATSAQTTVKSGSGILGVVAVNVPILTSAVRLYDNTVSGGAVIATLAIGVSSGSYPYYARFVSGLTVSTGAAADNITIMYN